MIIFAIAIIAIVLTLAVEFAGSKRGQKKGFVIDRIKFDGRKPIYKIMLGESDGEFCMRVPKEVFDKARKDR